jgi:hypothetical protein
MTSGLWNPYSNLEKQSQENKEKVNETSRTLNNLFYRVFTTEDGAKVLDYFVKHTLNQPSLIPGMQDNVGWWREGQNNIIREIKNRIEQSQK